MTISIAAAEAGEVPLEFLVGHHKRGGWFVVETHGLAGGLFRSELEAFKFLAGDFQTRAKRIQVVEETLDPFEQTSFEIALRCGDMRTTAISQSPAIYTSRIVP